MKKFLFCCLLLVLPLCAFASETDYSLSFNGVDQYVAIPHNDALNVNKVTIEMWIYWQETNGSDVDFLIAKAGEQLEIHTGGGALDNGLRFIPTTSVYFDTPPNSISANQWHHVAMMYDPSVPMAKCYVDGAEKILTNHGDSLSGKAIAVTSAELRLGRRADNSYAFKGRIDEVRIWNTTRTQQEIQDNMYLTLLGSEPGLVAYYRMSDGSGLSLTDNSGHGCTGTLMNGVQWSTSTATLPVELVAFSAHAEGRTVLLTWKTAAEIDNYGFEVQRQEAGAWRTIGFIEGKGTTNAPQSYSFTDITGGAGCRYRLRQIDRDGNSTFSSIALAGQRSVPQRCTLEQNYPNPFNGSTRLRFSISEAGRTRVKIHDLLGREVAVLVDETMEPGAYSVDWDAAAMPSGIYFYSIQSGTFSTVRSCIIQK